MNSPATIPVGAYRIFGFDDVAEMFHEDTHGMSTGHQIGGIFTERPTAEDVRRARLDLDARPGWVNREYADIRIEKFDGFRWREESDYDAAIEALVRGKVHVR